MQLRFQIVLAVCLASSVSAACAADEPLQLPSGIDYGRMQRLATTGNNETMVVQVQMSGIGEKQGGVHLLIPKRAGEAVGNGTQISRRFESMVTGTGRFRAFSDATTDMQSASVIRVDGMVVSATQNIEDLTAIRKSVTTIRLDLQVKNTTTGELFKARTVSGIYGSEPGEGTRVRTDRELSDPEVIKQLAGDFELALTEALGNAAAYLERTFRPIGKVTEVDLEDKVISLNGGSKHGIRANDRMVVFKANFVRDGNQTVPGIMKPVALVECDSVSDTTSQCRIIKQKGDVQAGHFALLTDGSLKLREE